MNMTRIRAIKIGISDYIQFVDMVQTRKVAINSKNGWIVIMLPNAGEFDAF